MKQWMSRAWIIGRRQMLKAIKRIGWSVVLLLALSATCAFTADFRCLDSQEELALRPQSLTAETALVAHAVGPVAAAPGPNENASSSALREKRRVVPRSSMGKALKSATVGLGGREYSLLDGGVRTIAKTTDASLGKSFDETSPLSAQLALPKIAAGPRIPGPPAVDPIGPQTDPSPTPLPTTPPIIMDPIPPGENDIPSLRLPGPQSPPKEPKSPLINPRAITISDEQVALHVTLPLRDAPPNSNGAKLLAGYTDHACAQDIVDHVASAEAKVRAIPSLGGAYRAGAEYLDNADSYKAKYGPFAAGAVKDYVDSLRTMLDSCYVPAEQSAFAIRHRLLQQIGRLSLATEPICTGLLLGSAQYMLTARHCFFYDVSRGPLDPTSLSNLWFQVGSGSNRYQACAIAESNAFAADRFGTVAADQVLVRIARGAPAPQKLTAVSKASLSLVSDFKQGVRDAPTLLAQISDFPLASKIDAAKYPSGMVQGKAPFCAAISKDSGCFVHMCSAIGGGSGSALFLAEDAGISLVGTHIGEATEAAADCRNAPFSNLNVAAYPNPVLFAPFLPVGGPR